MKKITCLAVCLAAAILAPFSLRADDTLEKATYQFSGFSAIEAGWVFEVEVIPSSAYGVEIEVTKEAMPYVKVGQEGTVLHLTATDIPQEITKKSSWHPVARAKIQVPSLSAITLGGSTKLSSTGLLPADGKFTLKAAGSAKVVSLKLDADLFDMSCEGATSFNIGGKLGVASATIAGASNGVLEAEIVKFTLDIQGASSIDMLKSSVDIATVSMAGASKCQISVKDKFSIKMGGVSSCKYADNPGLALDVVSVSRGATLKKL